MHGVPFVWLWSFFVPLTTTPDQAGGSTLILPLKFTGSPYKPSNLPPFLTKKAPGVLESMNLWESSRQLIKLSHLPCRVSAPAQKMKAAQPQV